jgi:hypothetical protein
VRKKVMYDARLFLTFLFMVVHVAGARTAIAAEDTSPPLATSHEVNIVRQVATALAVGRDAVRDLRGPPIENSKLDRLKLATPGMDCGIDRALVYVACHSASLNKKEAEGLFTKIMDDVESALPSDRWRQLEGVPRAGLIRSIRYFYRKTAAQIDVDIVAHPTGEIQRF